MRTSIATVCLSGTLEEKLRAAAAAGFDGVEIFEQDLVVSPLSPEEIRELAAQLGLSIDLFQPFRDLEGVTEEVFLDNLRRLEAKFRLMQRLGATQILVCSNAATASIDDDAHVAAQLRRAGDVAARYGVRLAYEALAWGRFVDDFEHAWRIVELADHPQVGTCLDSFHILSRRWDPSGIEDIPGEKIFFLQLADAPRLAMDVLSWSRHHRVFPGEGDFDLVGFLGHVMRAGYTGPVSLEIFNDSFRQTQTRRTAVDGLRSLRWLEDRTARALATPSGEGHGGPDAGASARPEPDRAHHGLDRLPEVAQPRGFDFVEIGTDRLGEVTRLLHQLGFSFGGYHRSKSQVQLWLQGEVRIVVSEAGVPQGEQAGVPQAPESRGPGRHGPGSVPGTALVGLGFDVADPEATFQRARRLGNHEVPRTQQPGEEVLRGVYAPDGTQVFFHEAGTGRPEWVAEFGVDASAPSGRDDGQDLIGAVDHINLAQPWQHYDEAVLFLTSMLALSAQQKQDVPSPIGLVRSQVMSSADGAIRLPLNVAPAVVEEGSLAGAGYPEHVALGCSDIFALAARAHARGLEFLEVPENYYEDLAARFDLGEDVLGRLREHHLLYDRDEHGEFLHFYTATLGEVFFEIVQRIDGYAGFGAPNAPVRLAAQFRTWQREG